MQEISIISRWHWTSCDTVQRETLRQGVVVMKCWWTALLLMHGVCLVCCPPGTHAHSHKRLSDWKIITVLDFIPLKLGKGAVSRSLQAINPKWASHSYTDIDAPAFNQNLCGVFVLKYYKVIKKEPVITSQPKLTFLCCHGTKAVTQEPLLSNIGSL